MQTDWKAYQMQQPKGALPVGPMLLMVHIASVWVPFTSESKDAIAHYPEIMKEIRLGLQECGRRVAMFIRKGRPVFATKARFRAADEVVVDWPDRYLQKVGDELTARDAVCVLTHDHKFDVPAITASLLTRVC